ncbi:Secreted protein [Plasmodiophora brassicae]
MLGKTMLAVLFAVVVFVAQGLPADWPPRGRVPKPTPLRRQVLEARVERACNAEHGELIGLLRSTHEHCEATLASLKESQTKLALSAWLVDIAIEATVSLEDALRGNASDGNALQVSLDRVSSLLRMIDTTPPERICDGARASLRREFWLRMLSAQPCDVPAIMDVRDQARTFKAFVDAWMPKIALGIDRMHKYRREIIGMVPDGLPPTVVFGRGYNTQ